MIQKSSIEPRAVHDTLRRHMLADGLPLVLDLEGSRGVTLRDAATGKEYLDFFGFFASNPLGFNHPALVEPELQQRMLRASTTKIANSDCYTTLLAEFVDTLERTAGPPELPYYFFVDGGALAVENALKTAFDWKVRRNLATGRGEKGYAILHFELAFHGRSGYTLSLTNTDPVKTEYFPKFDWPRVPAPAQRFPFDDAALADVEQRERDSLAAVRAAFDAHPDEIAAIIIEPIQGEGGDNHFRGEFFRELRQIANEREALLIFDEVQTGLGITGKWWAYQHFDVVPDIICFAKKMQVGGIMASERLDEVEGHVFETPSRINSTWGGSLADMVRATRVLEVIYDDGLLDNVGERGEELVAGLRELESRHTHVSNARGRGVMCAFDLPDVETRRNVVKACFDSNLLLLPCGTRSIRFRPPLTVAAADISEALTRLDGALSRAAAS